MKQTRYLTQKEVTDRIHEMTIRDQKRIYQNATNWYFRYGLRVKYCSRGPEDFVHDAFANLMSGTRRVPVAVPFVESVGFIIRSAIGHMSRKRVNIDLDINELANSLSYDQEPILGIDDIIDELLPLVKNIQYGNDYLNLLRQDPELKPKDIASLLNISPEKIYEVKRALRNRNHHFKPEKEAK